MTLRKGIAGTGFALFLLAILTVPLFATGNAEVATSKGATLTWLYARPSDGPVIQTVNEVEATFEKANPGIKLVLDTTPDRPSYLQKLRTLAAAGSLPDFFDTDATAFALKLKENGQLLDVGKMLTDMGIYDKFRPIALKYQQFDDGRTYMLPLEFHLEFTWYNKAIFQKYGIQVPETLDDLVAISKKLRDNGVIPMAVDGKDGWPLLRFLGEPAFRLAGNDFIKALKQDKAKFTDPIAMQSAQFVYDMGKVGAFQDGFSSMDYAQARDLFTSGKAAMYRMGTWELGTFISDSIDASVRDNIDYFTLPMMPGATTSRGDFFVNSGIGMAINAQKFGDASKKFLVNLIQNYPALYAAKQQFPPMAYDLPKDAKVSDLYRRVSADIGKLGEKFGIPWDTQLDPATNDRINQELVLLAMNQTTPQQFAATMQKVLDENAPKYFK